MARLRADATAIRDAFPDPWLRLYALKANGLPSLVANVAKAGGFSVSAVSRGEIDLALRAGLAPADIVLEGIGKTPADLDRAADLARRATPLAWVSLETTEDAFAMAAAAEGRSTTVDVLIRVNPQVAPETHSGLAVGHGESKFGVTPDELGSVIDAGGGPRGPLRWRGIHMHVGSQLEAIDAWRAGARIGLRLLRLQRARLRNFDTINFGGGFPVAYESKEETVPAASHFAEAVNAELEALPADARPARLVVEPGRAVVAGSGYLIAEVLHVRQRGAWSIIVLDAGMTELIRPALYNALHPMSALTSLGTPVTSTLDGPNLASAYVRVDGPICESTDTFGSVALPPLERGDLVAIGMTGAYGSSMFSTYNGRPRPAEVAWEGTRIRVWRRRGSLHSLP
jgi:diaminopimelate decarboxylase